MILHSLLTATCVGDQFIHVVLFTSNHRVFVWQASDQSVTLFVRHLPSFRRGKRSRRTQKNIEKRFPRFGTVLGTVSQCDQIEND